MALTATGLELAAGQHPACPCPGPSCTTSLTGSWGPAAGGLGPQWLWAAHAHGALPWEPRFSIFYPGFSF